MKALKLVFFADRYHLRKYGRPITNDEYFAMNYGPVPSGVKDIAEGLADFLAEVEKNYASEFIEPVDDKEFRAIAPPELKVFSETDREALDFAWRTFGHLNQYDLADLTHQYPEWKMPTNGCCHRTRATTKQGHEVDKEGAWQHSKWCEFLYQRLMIARDLLRKDGAVSSEEGMRGKTLRRSGEMATVSA